MKYLCPHTLEQAEALLAGEPEARVLAGGQSLLPAMRLGLAAPECLVDLQSIAELRAISLDQGMLRIGAMATHAEIARSPLVQQWAPFLARLAGGIGDQQVRNMGTIGGSLANNDPAACWPAGVLACSARIYTTQGVYSADDFFVDLFATALRANEIITSVAIDIGAGPLAGAYLKFEQLASRFALTGVAMVRSGATVRIAITGLGAGVCLWPEAQQALGRNFSAQAIQGLRFNEQFAFEDLHASARYRAQLVGVLTKRCLHLLTPSSIG